MRKVKTLSFTTSWLNYVIPFLAGCFLLLPLEVQATAPRVSAQMFGEEKHADIVGYQFSPIDEIAKLDGVVITEIVTEAFKASNMAPTIDMLPSKQLASYALINNEATGFIGLLQDLGDAAKNKYPFTNFFFRGDDTVALIFSNNKQGKAFHEAFNQGLQKIIKDGKYTEIMEKRFGNGKVPDDYLLKLKKQTPSWK